MLTRREFIQAGAGLAAVPFIIKSGELAARSAADYFAVHPFVENNPDAVFIMKTSVADQRNAAAVKQAGLQFANSAFIRTDDAQAGISFDHSFVIKPNLTSRGEWMRGYTVDSTMGVITDGNFVEGVIDSMKETGIQSNNIYVREVNGAENLTDGGYNAVASRTGADIQVVRPPYNSSQLVWKDVPDGVFFSRIPYLAPVNAADSWLLNISKFKAHGMGLTLCAKNIQGSIASPYQAHCTPHYSNMGLDAAHVQPNAKANIRANYERHRAGGIPRWDIDSHDHTGGLGMETWATRCLDNHSATTCGLHVIEGVYGRDGNFVEGPHNGLAKDFLTNVIIFGKNAFYVDIIGHWLGGHEPGNFGLFHMARERGFIETINPASIPVYQWNEQSDAMLAQLTDFERTPLLTNYMKKSGEAAWHMVDEPYDYMASSRVVHTGQPESFLLKQNYPNPFNPSTQIEFRIPAAGQARLEVFNTRGEVVRVLHDQMTQKGSHLVRLNAQNLPSGTYFYRLLHGGFSETRRFVLVR